MNLEQRNLYFGKLWPQACKAQGWKRSDEHRRKLVTFAATGEESSSQLDQDQITLLFNKLKALADPQDFDKALADSDPAAALAENKRQNIIFRIVHAASKIPGDPEAGLAKLASERFGGSDWRKLGHADLLRFSMQAAKNTTKGAVARRSARSKASSKSTPALDVQPECRAENLPF